MEGHVWITIVVATTCVDLYYAHMQDPEEIGCMRKSNLQGDVADGTTGDCKHCECAYMDHIRNINSGTIIEECSQYASANVFKRDMGQQSKPVGPITRRI